MLFWFYKLTEEISMSNIAVIKQKGGTGASALATTLAIELAKSGETLLVDLDPNQQTSLNRLKLRADKHSKYINVKAALVLNDGRDAVKESNQYEHTVFDGAATASVSSIIIAKHSDLILIPTGLSKDDLDPNIQLAYELISEGINTDKIFIVFNNASGTASEQRMAAEYLAQTPLNVMPGVIENKTCYRQALNSGKVLTEVSFVQPRVKAKELVKQIINQLSIK